MELHYYLRLITKYWWILLLCSVIGSGLAIYQTSRQPPRYRSTAILLLSPALTREALLTDPDTVTYRLAATYARYLKTRAFATIVIEQAELDISPETLVRSIDANVVGNTQFFEISATSGSPEGAQRIASTVTDYFIREILDQQREQERIRQSTSELTALQASLLEDLDGDRAYYEEAVATLRARVEELEAASATQRDIEAITAARERLTVEEEKLLQVITNLITLRPVGNSSLITSVTLIEAASFPVAPLPRGRLSTLLTALALSLGIGFGIAWALEQFDLTVRTPEELEELYGLPTLGQITRLRNSTKQQENGVLLLMQPQSTHAEAVRSLRTNIQFASAGAPLRSLVVTSAIPGEGKTTIACNLAVVMAQANRRVILVDTDLRRPTIHRRFGLPNERGFTTLLIDGSPLEAERLSEYLQPTEVPNLLVLTSGPIPPNPAALLSLERTRQIQELLVTMADKVIYDSPPLLTVTDAAILASQSDGALHVVQAGRTRQNVVVRARQMLELAGARILGTALNQVGSVPHGYHYSYSYRTDTGEKTDSVKTV